MRTWQLFVDESGASWIPEESFFIGGLLVLDRGTQAWSQALETRLREASAGILWPPHSNRLGIPAILVEGALRGADGCSPTARALAEEVMGVDDPAVTDWIDDLVDDIGSESGLTVLEAADGWLRRNHWPAWQQLSEELRSIRGRLLTELHTLDGGVAVGCLDPVGDPTERAEDRYLRAYQGMFERVVMLLGPSEGLVVRTLAFPGVGYDDLREAIVRVRPPNDLVSHHVRPSPYAAGVHPGLVLADLVANRLRPLLRGSWSQVRRDARRRLGVSVELPAVRLHHRALPTIAAAGPPRRRLRARFEGRQEPTTFPPPSLRWTEEQVDRWIMALERRSHPSPSGR